MTRTGRPSKYDPDRHPLWAAGLAKLGKTDDEISTSFGIVRSTLLEWKKAYPELSVALRIGKEEANMQVMNTLYRRANGYEIKESKVIQLPDGDKRIEVTTKEVLPEPGCIKLWLTNRMPEEWRERITQELTGKDGGPIVHKYELVEGVDRVSGSKDE